MAAATSANRLRADWDWVLANAGSSGMRWLPASDAPAAAVPHEIVLRISGSDIGLSCSCRRIPRRGRAGWDFIGMRSPFPAGEAIGAWRAWHAERGVTV